MKREKLVAGIILERVQDYAPWWAIDVNVKVGDLFEYVGPNKFVENENSTVQVRKSYGDYLGSLWNITMHHFIHKDGTIAIYNRCMWK